MCLLKLIVYKFLFVSTNLLFLKIYIFGTWRSEEKRTTISKNELLQHPPKEDTEFHPELGDEIRTLVTFPKRMTKQWSTTFRLKLSRSLILMMMVSIAYYVVASVLHFFRITVLPHKAFKMSLSPHVNPPDALYYFQLKITFKHRSLAGGYS